MAWTIQIKSDSTHKDYLNIKIQKQSFKGIVCNSKFFEALINGYCSESTYTKSDDDVYRLLGRFEKVTGTFNIGGKQLTFSTDDILLIFGIKSSNVPMEIGRGNKLVNSPFVDRRFPDVDRLSKTILEDKLNEALEGKKKDSEDAACILVLLACLTLFISTTGTTIGWTYIAHVETFEGMNSYMWCEEIRLFLMSLVEKMSKKPQKVTGCVVALLV